MRLHAITIAMLLLCVGTAMAQYETTYPRVLLPYENSVCRVTCDDGDGTQSHGSGVLVQPPAEYGDKDYVLTAYHVIRDRRSDDIRITFDGTRFYSSRVAAALPVCDSALLLIAGTVEGVPRIAIAETEVQPGELAYGFGFGDSRNVLRSTGGRVVALTQNSKGDPSGYLFAGYFRDGDSGGPVFVVRQGRPYLIGNAWGCTLDKERKHYAIAANRLCVLRHLFGIRLMRRRTSPTRTIPVTSGST